MKTLKNFKKVNTELLFGEPVKLKKMKTITIDLSLCQINIFHGSDSSNFVIKMKRQISEAEIVFS